MEEVKREIMRGYDLLDMIEHYASESRNNLYELEHKLEKIEKSGIKDVEGFKRELNRTGLLTENLNEFIDNYMRFYNE